ncbi:hypothetical protein N5C70_06100 [Pseudomonas juntendi]|uniref:Uncharacterized protein n=1 Tax=Pseudomonas juntendi TaxID=2666183 RepID=A0ABD4YAB2_9PSED|nr:hypothetical protein [Pseudomonas juntendi]MDH0756304.1 hypothetical protein [Pseudomonas juntendi]MDH1921897.1 hypothetical protein [Pseudomonas juntendi]
MNQLNDRRPTLPSALIQAMLTMPLLLSSVAADAADTTRSNLADPTPLLSLYQTVDNNTEPACGFELPEAGSGTTVKLLPNKECPSEAREPHSIRIRNVPIKSTFLLTDNERCEKLDSSWVELDTSRANASLEKMGIDKIWTYAGRPEKPGYLTNSGLDNNVPSRGFRVIGKGDPIKQGDLTCIVVTIAPRSI